MQQETQEEADAKVAQASMPFVKGNPKPSNSGRRKGTPNKETRAVREFLAELCDDHVVQRAVRRKILKGNDVGFFRALDKIVPDAPKTFNVNERVEWYMLPAGDDVAED